MSHWFQHGYMSQQSRDFCLRHIYIGASYKFRFTDIFSRAVHERQKELRTKKIRRVYVYISSAYPPYFTACEKGHGRTTKWTIPIMMIFVRNRWYRHLENSCQKLSFTALWERGQSPRTLVAQRPASASQPCLPRSLTPRLAAWPALIKRVDSWDFIGKPPNMSFLITELMTFKIAFISYKINRKLFFFLSSSLHLSYKDGNFTCM